MEITFSQIHLDQSTKVDQKILHLIESELGPATSIETLKRKLGYKEGRSLLYGAFVNDELVAMNMWIKLVFFLNSDEHTGYHSCFSATENNFKGNGIWPKLMAYCEYEIEGTGASLLFGHPNDISYPLFVKKLNYQEQKQVRVFIPRFILWVPYLFSHMSKNDPNKPKENIFQPSLEDNIVWKKIEETEDFYQFEFCGSKIWGKIRNGKKYFFNFRYFEIGGIHLKESGHFKILLNQIFKIRKIHMSTMVVNEKNPFNFKSISQKINTVSITKPINGFSLDNARLEFFRGMADTF
mgnify:FL=1